MPESPVPRPGEEVRFGLVLYGGLSLAVYMGGVAAEFWRLVRAGRGAERNAYTEVLTRADVAVTVDVISGTSAGGINGVLLGKALATGGDLSLLRRFWIERGGMAELLHDPGDPAPGALFRSAYFEEQLAEALLGMDRATTGQPLVDVLDVFVSSTRLRGVRREVTDGLGNAVHTLRYRTSFRLRYRRKGYNPADRRLGYDQNDFGENPMLVEAARATSAFPFALEPKLIELRDDNGPLFEPGDPDAAYFADGGILHNRPFTEAVSTIVNRMAGVPARRYLVSVDPDPEELAPTPAPGPEPDVLDVVQRGLFTIPRYQSIASDLESLERHNRRVDDLHRLLLQIEAVVARTFGRQVDAGTEKTFRGFLERQVLWHAYQALKVDAVVRELADRILRAADVPEEERPHVDAGVRAAASLDRARDPGGGRAAAFLDAFDDGYRIRRLSYLIETVNRFVAALAPAEQARFQPVLEGLWASHDGVRSLVWEIFEGDTDTAEMLRDDVRGKVGSDLRTAVEDAVPEIGKAYRRRLRTLRSQTETLLDRADRHRARSPEVPEPRRTFRSIFERYEVRDMLILPVEALADVGERTQVGFARIAPSAATYVKKAPEDKLAGDTLGHFGGFLSDRWRANDFLWGRLDAAEVIVRLLLPREERSLVEEHIHRVQDEIARQELAPLRAAPGLDYKAYLEQQHTVGAEDLAALPPEETVPTAVKAAGVTHAMLEEVEQQQGQQGLRTLVRSVRRILGAVLGVIRWPVLAIWGRTSVVRGVVALALMFMFGWGLLLLLMGALGVIGLTGRVWLWAVAFLAPPLAWFVLLGVSASLRRLRRLRPPPA